MNAWLRFGLPALVVFGLGYAVRASDDTEYATEGLHRVLVIAALVAVVIGIVVWMGEKDSPEP
jgi:sugar phosphate permease